MLLDDLSALLDTFEELGYESKINATPDGSDAIQRLENFVQMRPAIVERTPSQEAIDVGVRTATNGSLLAQDSEIPIERVIYWVYREMVRLEAK